MPSSISVKIVIKEDGKVFFPGEKVEGVVEVEVLKETSINTIILKAKGFANVKWQRHNNETTLHQVKTNVKTNTHHVKTEKYYKIICNLFEDKGCPKVLPEGTHNFDFNYEIPLHVPCSFESKYGYVRHVCKAVVNVAGKFFDVKHNAILSVGVVVDLNYDPIAKNQIQEHKEKKGIFNMTDVPHLSLTLKIGHSGYVSGENLIINAECSNRSNHPTKKTKIELFQTITYRAIDDKKVIKKLICSKVHPGVENGADDIWSGSQLTVPPVPPTGLPGCSIIIPAYHLKFTFSPHFPSRDLSVSVPIIIGTIPLKETFGTFVPGYSDLFRNHLQSLGPNFESGAFALSEDSLSDEWNGNHTAESFPWSGEYPDLPCPSFKAFTKKKKIEDSENSEESDSSLEREATNKPTKYWDSKTKLDFTPLYVFYNQEIPKINQVNDSSEDVKFLNIESLSVTNK